MRGIIRVCGVLIFAIGLFIGELYGREVISLDGEWQIAEGSSGEMPKVFPSKCPVPGFVDLAKPAFKDVGAYVPESKRMEKIFKPSDPLREAWWYKRTTVLKNIPDTAQLKILRAAYTSELYINGRLVGSNYGSYTPYTFDVRRFLKEGENEIVIKVGASPAQIPAKYTIGYDFEKSRYNPGIYDSVYLILSGKDFLDDVQIVPDLDKGGIRVVGDVFNNEYIPPSKATSRDYSFKPIGSYPIKLTVRERKSREVVAEKTIESPVVNRTGCEKFDTFVEIPEAKLWSPESPFLYELEVATPNDKYTSRFGMRSFSGTSKEAFFRLNKKPYWMRGTNICFFRFAEDKDRKDLVWNKEWVRKLHKGYKDAHWNSIRYCIGFPPEFWYEIADEEGFLIQDEFPIWTLAKGWTLDNSVDTLSVEFSNWMKEHKNYPSVVIWDGQNESKDIEFLQETVRKLRDYDLSKRPWDFGWDLQMRDGDSHEVHPYRTSRVHKQRFNKKWSAKHGRNYMFPQDLKYDEGGKPGGTKTYPFTLNEYCWLWINRDGSCPTLTKPVFSKLCGKENPTTEEMRLIAARYIALMSEFWRSERNYAMILNFCSLTYNRADGQTCDNFIDIDNLVYEPLFKEYVFDSFTPMGIFIRYYEDVLKGGTNEKIEVVCINDEYDEFDGKMILEVKGVNGGKVISGYEKEFSVESLGKSKVEFDIKIPDNKGKYDLVATAYKRVGGKYEEKRYTRSVRYLNVE